MQTLILSKSEQQDCFVKLKSLVIDYFWGTAFENVITLLFEVVISRLLLWNDPNSVVEIPTHQCISILAFICQRTIALGLNEFRTARLTSRLCPPSPRPPCSGLRIHPKPLILSRVWCWWMEPKLSLCSLRPNNPGSAEPIRWSPTFRFTHLRRGPERARPPCGATVMVCVNTQIRAIAFTPPLFGRMSGQLQRAGVGFRLLGLVRCLNTVLHPCKLNSISERAVRTEPFPSLEHCKDFVCVCVCKIHGCWLGNSPTFDPHGAPAPSTTTTLSWSQCVCLAFHGAMECWDERVMDGWKLGAEVEKKAKCWPERLKGRD